MSGGFEMRRKIEIFMAVSVAFLYLGNAAFAQHGRGPAGGSVGGPGMTTMPGRSAPSDLPAKSHPPENPTTPETAKTSGPEMGKGTHTNSPHTPSEELTKNTQLSSKLQGLLPAGTNLQDAAGGFKNTGQFVAAVHVSHNLDIPFDQLKTKVAGGESLGKAIHELKPNADAKAEVRKAEKQAKEDQKGTRT
jgi:hypothetical protein